MKQFLLGWTTTIVLAIGGVWLLPTNSAGADGGDGGTALDSCFNCCVYGSAEYCCDSVNGFTGCTIIGGQCTYYGTACGICWTC